jgi:hypothetical protein
MGRTAGWGGRGIAATEARERGEEAASSIQKGFSDSEAVIRMPSYRPGPCPPLVDCLIFATGTHSLLNCLQEKKSPEKKKKVKLCPETNPCTYQKNPRHPPYRRTRDRLCVPPLPFPPASISDILPLLSCPNSFFLCGLSVQLRWHDTYYYHYYHVEFIEELN